MELVLGLHNGSQVRVACDGRASHAFALESVVAADPAALYNALFPPGSPALAALASAERLALVLDEALDSLPWELSRGPEGWLALQMPLVRLTPPGSRQPAPKLDSPLRVLAVPSNPVARDLPPLNIAGEWRRLREAFEKLTHSARLERVTPPTLDSLRRAALRSPQAVVHFMGHGGQTDEQAVLFFESDAGGLQPVTAKDFALSVGKQAFLVTLNACVSAAPGPTEFSNLAYLLALRGLPYALGMSASIPDGDALTFSRALYENLAAGVDVEQAVFQARRSLLRGNPREWLVGVPVLYSSLEEPAGGFARLEGQPQIDEGQPPLEINFVLPRAEGAFQGRVDELLKLGQALTGDSRPKVFTIHGAGGQGKTALAREAAERFAHAWPGGVWAISLENKPDRATFCFQLAKFLKIPTSPLPPQPDLERAILTQLEKRRMLVILDNAETFTEAIRAADLDALDLAAFLKEGLLGTDAVLLITSREPLGWPGEQWLPLEGLSQSEGAALFTQSAPQRQNDIQNAQAEWLSARLDGHPLALLLLGLAFNDTAISLEQFIAEHETRLLDAENKYKTADHRHRTPYASIETSTRYLSEDERTLLSGLWIFQSPFLSEVAKDIFVPYQLPEAEFKAKQEKVADNLLMLSRRGLLIKDVHTVAEGNILFYRTLPIVNLFARHYLEQDLTVDVLHARVGEAYRDLAEGIYGALDHSNWASYIAAQCREDLEACANWVEASQYGWYTKHLGYILQRLGDRQAGLRWFERGLASAQGTDQQLELHILTGMADIYRLTKELRIALEFYKKALPIARALNNQEGEAAILNNIALVYHAMGQPSKALELFEQALSIDRMATNKVGEASILSNMAGAYIALGNRAKALKLSEQALTLRQDTGDLAGEAATLSITAALYQNKDEPEKILAIYTKMLALMNMVGDEAGEASTLLNIGGLYQNIGDFDKSLELFEQSLLIAEKLNDRALKAFVLNSIASIYRLQNKADKALELHEQALWFLREVDDQVEEANTLDHIAWIYQFMLKEPNQALRVYEQVLSIQRTMEKQANEAATLNRMGGIYYEMGSLEEALKFFDDALLVSRTAGYRDGEATALNNLGLVHHALGKSDKALKLFEQALPIYREVGNEEMEAKVLTSTSFLLYPDPSRRQDAIGLFKQAIAILQKLGLSQFSAGTSYKTVSEMQDMLKRMETGQSLGCAEQPSIGSPIQQVEIIGANTLAVLTDMPEKRLEWHETVTQLLQQAQVDKMQADIEFLTAILALLDGKTPALSTENPYAWAMQILLQKLPARVKPPALPADFVARCVGGLIGEIAQKMSLADELAAMAKASTDAGELVLIDTVQRALFGAPIEWLGQSLSGTQAQVWQEIVRQLQSK